jgi:ABC-type Na+ transport system ATPase subunit NatA/ABC-type Na+ efflux pump permease subunit
MIEVTDLKKSFGALEAVRGVTFSAPDGRITGLLGPNGAGKSTTLRIISTVLKPSAGSVKVDGADVLKDGNAARMGLGVLPHQSGLYPRLTARENIHYYGELNGVSGAALTRRIDELLELLEIGDFADRPAKGFSQGQRIKVALARAMVHGPRNLVLDEPTNGLDVMATRALRALIRKLKDTGHCVLFSSHVMQEVAALCDSIVIIAQGRIVARGTVDELRRQTGETDLEEAFVKLCGTEAAVFFKEAVDNLRDRRTLLTVLVFGPLFGPLFYTVMMSTVINRQIADLDQSYTLAVQGADYAPGLMGYVRQHNLKVEAAPADARAAVKTGKLDVVLVIPAGYASAFSAGQPAEVQLLFDKSRESAGKNIERVRDVLEGYTRAVGALRLLARGVDPRAATPIVIEDADVSTPQSRAVLLLGMMPYFLLFAAILGAFYLAIDSTAGERERGSLEPLLTTAVPRSTLVLGKLSAVTLFSAVSLSIDIVALIWCQHLIPAAKVGIAVDFTPANGIATLLVCLPFCLFIAGLLSVVASFTKSYKEAQTWLSFIMIVPLVPVLGLVMFPMEPAWWMMLLPSMSQDVLVTELIKGEPLKPLFVTLSVVSTLLCGAGLSGLAIWLYKREQILG